VVTVHQVRQFWEQHPLCEYEIPFEPGTKAFFDAHDALKSESTDRFNMHLWEFDKHPRERVLDVGCGPGWLVQEYARGGANVVGVDITARALELAKRRLELRNLKGEFIQANAESLPFDSSCFDFISSSGVLHHTPETEKAIHEIYRVLKPGKKAAVSLYARHFLFSPILWPLTRVILRRIFLATTCRNNSDGIQSIDDFTKLYDGDYNPMGKSYTARNIQSMFSCFSSLTMEAHYFPKRFIDPFIRIENTTVLRMFDRLFGSMIFAIVEK